MRTFSHQRPRRRTAATIFIVLINLLGAAVLAVPSPSARADGLSAYRGRNRVLLVFAPSREDARYRRQDALLRGESAGMKDRDLILRFEGTDATAERRRFGIKKEQFRAILIGKDGNAVTSSARPLSSQSLFRLIDAMPMRRDEVRRRSPQ